MRKFYILTVIFALFGISQVWANEAASANNSSDIVNGNVVINAPHATFTLDGVKDFEEGDGGYRVYKSLGKSSQSPLTLTWKIDNDAKYSIAVTKISFKGRAYNSNAFLAGNGKIEFNGVTTNVGTAALTQDYADISSTDNFESGIQIICINTSSGLFGGSFDFYIKDLKIEYTITPNTPEVTGSGETAIDVTVDLDNKQTVNLRNWFSLANAPQDFTLVYRSSEGGIIEGNNFYATEAGVYTVDAQIKAGEDHAASAWSGDLTITVNHLDQNLVWKNEASVKEPMYIDDEQTMEITASSGLEVSFVSSAPEVVSVDANGKLTAKSIGEATITASQVGNKQYNPAEPIVRKFTVAYAPQTLSWENEGAIHTSMVLGGEQTIRAIATSGLEVQYESSDESVLSVDANGNLTANALGTATITASQAGNGKFLPAESITKTFEVKEKETPFFNPSGFSEEGINKLHVEQQVTLEVANVSEGDDLSEGDFTAVVSDENVLYVYRDGNVITIEAVGVGQASVTFEQKELEFIHAATKTYSFDVRKENLLALAVDPAEVLELYVDDEIPGLIADQNSDGEISTESSDATIAHFDVVNNVLVVSNSEAKSFDETEVTIAIRQAETEEYQAAEFTLNLKVSKYDNQVYVTGEENYVANLYPGQILEGIYFESAIPDEDKEKVAPIEVNQTSGKQIAVLMEEEQQVQALASEGTALWTISQPESYKYKAASASLRINVAKLEEEESYVMNVDDGEGGHRWETAFESKTYAYDVDAPGDYLFFQAKREKMSGFSNNENWYVQYAVTDGKWIDLAGPIDIPETSTWYSFKFAIPAEARYVRFDTRMGATGYRYVRNVRVTRKAFINADFTTIEAVAEEEGTSKLKISYSLANGGVLRLLCDNPKFSFGPERTNLYSLSNEDHSVGTAEVDVYYTGEEIGDDATDVVIFNGVYSKIVHLTATVKDPQTAVENVENEDRATKILRDGQIFILRDGKVYDLRGQVVR